MALGSSGGVAGSGIGLTDPSLSFGLTGISDYGVEMPFLDLMKAARPFYGDRASGGTAKLSDLGASVLDADGWPREIPAGMKSVSTVWDWSGTGSDAAVKAQRVGTYVLEYEGSGKITVAGSVKVLSSEPGRIVFDNTGGGTMRVSITQTDPGHTGDYIRDISVVAQKYEALHAAGEIFNPGFLAVVQDARELRFMDWMKTNGSEQRDFGARPEVSDATWSGPGGVPLEVMVQLANQTGTDPWFCMPAKATDAYVASFAAYVRDHLDPALKAHVEFSNETWNWSFSQTGWLDGQAKALWGSKAAVYDYVAMRATQVALIWDETFGSQADARVENVLAVQTANPGVASRELAGKLWAQHDPAGFVAPGSVFDALAVTTYFGNSVMSQPDRRAELLAKIRDPHVDAVAWLAGKLMDPAYSSSIPQLEGKWAANKAIADAYGLDLVAYEGGQHAHQSFAINGISAGDLAVLTDFMTGFVRSPQMGALYGALWDAWAEVSDGAFMQFGDVGQPSKWGSWGLLSSLGDTNPRATEILANNAANDAWFGDGGGARYQQGKILQAGNGGETLVGTQKIDFLVGGKGDDTLIAGRGDDGINGGAGYDTLVLAGSPDAYAIKAEGEGYRITGPDGSDYVVNVEAFRFDGAKTMTLAQFLAHAPGTGGGNAAPPPVIPPEPVQDGKIDLKGALFDAGGLDGVTAHATSKGVQITAINNSSVLGRELFGTANSDSHAYVVSERGASATIGGVKVGATYTVINDNAATRGGHALSATATETVLKLGSIVTDAHAITGTAASDTFTGRQLDDIFYGAGGNDTMSGGDGDDQLYGGTGNDVLNGGNGNDILNGGSGNDRIDGGAGTDTLVLSGHASEYRIVKEGSAYRLTGHDGVDTVQGVERFAFDGNEIKTLAQMIDLSKAPPIAHALVAMSAPVSLALAGALVDSSGSEGAVVADTARGVQVSGVNAYSALGREMFGDESHNVAAYIVAEKGTSATFDGVDVQANYASLNLNQGAGGATLSSSAMETTLRLASLVTGANSITLTSGNDTLTGRNLDDTVHGGAGNDTISGGEGHDTLYGDAGNDVLRGGPGDDILWGGAGRDQFVIATGDGTNRIMDFSAEDRLDLRSLGITTHAALDAHASLDGDGNLQIVSDGVTTTLAGLHEADLAWISLMT